MLPSSAAEKGSDPARPDCKRARNGRIRGRRATLETVTAIVRAGAGIVITYAAADIATWLSDES